MSVNARISLPPHVNDDDVCALIAICAGAKAERQPYGAGESSWSARVDGLSFEPASFGRFPSCIRVEFTDAEGQRLGLHYYPRGGEGGGPYMLPPSSPLWIAMGRRLIAAFGGKLAHTDWSEEWSETVEPADASITPEDCAASNNEGFRKRQRFLAGAMPLSREELISASDASSYAYERGADGELVGSALSQASAFGARREFLERLEAEIQSLEDASAPRSGSAKKRARPKRV